MRRAHPLSLALGSVAGLALGLALAGCGASEPMPTSVDDYARQLFNEVNLERSGSDYTELTWNDCLAHKAAPRAELAATEASLEHEPLFATCNPGVASGENLSRGDFTPHEIVTKWMASEGHKANILKAGFTDAGIACVALPHGADGYACSLLFEGGD